jgi:hypothetical protein
VEGPVILSYSGHALPPLTLPATEQFPQACDVGTPAWLPDHTEAVAVGDGVAWVAYLSEGEVVLSGVDTSTGALLTSQRLFDLSPFEVMPPMTLLADGRRLAVARGETVELRRGLQHDETIELGQEVRRMVSARDCIAVSTETGGAVLWRRGGRTETHRFAAGLPAPHLAFSGDARLVAMTRFEARAYATDEYGLRHLATFAGPGEDLVTLLPAGRGLLASLSQGGRVRLFRLPGV